MTDRLVDAYDAALFDLDGVIYRGPAPVTGAVEALAGLRLIGVPVGFVTNNAFRTPEDISAQLIGLGVACEPAEVIVSSQALARLMSHRLPAGTKVLVAGPPALAAEMARAGFVVVARADEAPAALVQGYHPDLPWSMMDEAAFALARGAAWYATNTDTLRPTDAGMVPGAGAQIAALRACFPGLTPVIAGKPYPPLFEEMPARLGVRHPIFVGDRLDTDVAGARGAGLDTLFVLSGAHGKADLVAAPPEQRPTFLGPDAGALLAAPRRAAAADDGTDAWSVGQARAVVTPGGTIDVAGPVVTPEQQADALWAVANLAWRRADRGAPTDAAAALERLALLP